MKNPSAKQGFAEDIKREILRDLSRTYGQHYQEQNLVDNIKQEVLMDLGIHHQGQTQQWDRSLIEAIKNEVLYQIQGERQSYHHGESHYPRSTSMENRERGDRAQFDNEGEYGNMPHQGEYGKMSTSYRGDPDTALIQAVKDSVMAEMNISNYR